MDIPTTPPEASKRPRRGLRERGWYYNRVSKHFPRALKVWLKALDSPSESIRLQAANQIMARIIPELKSMELTGEGGGPVQYTVLMGGGFNPTGAIEGALVPTGEGSTPGGDGIPKKELEAGGGPEKVQVPNVAILKKGTGKQPHPPRESTTNHGHVITTPPTDGMDVITPSISEGDMVE